MQLFCVFPGYMPNFTKESLIMSIFNELTVNSSIDSTWIFEHKDWMTTWFKKIIFLTQLLEAFIFSTGMTSLSDYFFVLCHMGSHNWGNVPESMFLFHKMEELL